MEDYLRRTKYDDKQKAGRKKACGRRAR